MRSGHLRVVNTKDFIRPLVDVLLRTCGMSLVLEKLYIFDDVTARNLS
jgi:hypothetical protein